MHTYVDPRDPDEGIDLFINRSAELDRFAQLIAGLEHGRRWHLALLGLRRIGKTMLLDAVRRRHRATAIAYLGVDEVVSTPEQFARAFATEILVAAASRTGQALSGRLVEDAASFGGEIERAVSDLLDLARHDGTNGMLITSTFRFPSLVARSLGIPLLIMLDEFQDIARLERFPNTHNLLGTVRAALDRHERVAYVVAGSRVTALRAMLSHGDSPLFTRFQQLELGPFDLPATADLATRIWEADDVDADADASARVQRLSGGWPFYVDTLAARAGQMAHSLDITVSPDIIDAAFEHELLGRAGAIGQQCRYLLSAAIESDASDLRNTLDAVVRRIAVTQPVSRAALADALSRDHDDRQVYRAVNRLIATDVLREESGQLELVDGVFGAWLSLEPARRDPAILRNGLDARRKLLQWAEGRHAEDRHEMGSLFERRVENIARQFRGQQVPARDFGLDGQLTLPNVRDAGRIRVEDPRAHYGQRPDTYELDIATVGEQPQDAWAIEAKHRVGAITRVMVERFRATVAAVERDRNLTFARCWIVAPRGIRADAQLLARELGYLTSGQRGLERLERRLARHFDPQAQRGR